MKRCRNGRAYVYCGLFDAVFGHVNVAQNVYPTFPDIWQACPKFLVGFRLAPHLCWYCLVSQLPSHDRSWFRLVSVRPSVNLAPSFFVLHSCKRVCNRLTSLVFSSKWMIVPGSRWMMTFGMSVPTSSNISIFDFVGFFELFTTCMLVCTCDRVFTIPEASKTIQFLIWLGCGARYMPIA